MGALTKLLDRIPLKERAMAAQVAARLAVYGPLAGLSFFFLPWALPVLGLAVIEPLPTNLLLKGAQWVSEKVPVAGPVVKVGLNSWMGAKWWAHAGALEAALALLIPVHFIPWNLSRILVPALFLTAFPLATRYVHAFVEQIPWVRERAVVKQQEAAARQMEQQLQTAGPSVPGAPAVRGVDVPGPATKAEPAVQEASVVDSSELSSVTQQRPAMSVRGAGGAVRLAGRPVAFSGARVTGELGKTGAEHPAGPAHPAPKAAARPATRGLGL